MGYPIFRWDLVLCRKASVLAFVSISLFLFRTSEACNNVTFSGSSFKIAIFADLHYGENAWTDWGPLQDLRSDNVMSRVLDTEKPDFVVYLGDILTANNLPVRNASSYWKRAVSAAKSRNLPWASVFGNHDDMAFEWPLEWFGPSGLPPIQCFSPTLHSGSRTYEHMLELEVSRMDVSSSNDFECYFQRTTRAELIQLDMEEPLSCTLSGNTDLWPSVSNYVLEVYSHNDKGNPSAFLYFLDSGGGSYPEVISARQATWFKQTSAQKNPNSRIPEIIFWHIPSQAFEKVAPTRNAIRHPCIGSINLEAVAAQAAEWGILDILTNRTSVKAIIVGHNHGLDWCCPYKNLWLCFARHTGYGGYGSWPRGARIVELIQQPFVINSWIRMEDGTVHSQVDLTYV